MWKKLKREVTLKEIQARSTCSRGKDQALF